MGEGEGEGWVRAWVMGTPAMRQADIASIVCIEGSTYSKWFLSDDWLDACDDAETRLDEKQFVLLDKDFPPIR